MSDLHEKEIAAALGGRRTRGSGCTAQDATDVVSLPDDEFAWAADCKSTLAASTTASVATWEKLEGQADGRMALLPLRCYADDRLSYSRMDVVALAVGDLAELLYWARMGKRASRVVEGEGRHLADAVRAIKHETEAPLEALRKLAEALGVPVPCPSEDPDED